MLSRRSALSGLAATLLVPSRGLARTLGPDGIRNAGFEAGIDLLAATPHPTLARLQIMLDRAHFSPGVIDARGGDNTANAVSAYRSFRDIQEGEGLTEAVWKRLRENFDGPVLREYEISEKDVEGPFLDRLPDRMVEQAKLDHLGYTSPRELLAERFHMDEELLRALNPDADFTRAGQSVVVANVERSATGKATSVKVNIDERSLHAFNEAGDLLAHFPATVGSKSRPAPKGTFKITRIVTDPMYTYDPERLDFEGIEADEPFDIAPGPNNPVGSVWIEIDEDGYAVHGTPEPAEIGKTFSHGCIRLTNWDALHLAQIVARGVELEIR